MHLSPDFRGQDTPDFRGHILTLKARCMVHGRLLPGQKWSCCFKSAETFSKTAIYTSFGNVKKCVKQICMRCCSDHIRDAEYIVVASRGLCIISRVANFRRYGKHRKGRPKLDEKGAIWMLNRIIMIIINCKIALSYSQKWHGDRKCLFSRLLLYLQNFGKGVCKLPNRGQQINITLLTLPKDGMRFRGSVGL